MDANSYVSDIREVLMETYIEQRKDGKSHGEAVGGSVEVYGEVARAYLEALDPGDFAAIAISAGAWGRFSDLMAESTGALLKDSVLPSFESEAESWDSAQDQESDE